MESFGAAPHLNTSFKHFIFFVLEFDLLEDRELEALSTLGFQIRIFLIFSLSSFFSF